MYILISMIATVMRQGWEDKCEVAGQGSFALKYAGWLSTIAHVCNGALWSHSNSDVMTPVSTVGHSMTSLAITSISFTHHRFSPSSCGLHRNTWVEQGGSSGALWRRMGTGLKWKHGRGRGVRGQKSLKKKTKIKTQNEQKYHMHCHCILWKKKTKRANLLNPHTKLYTAWKIHPLTLPKNDEKQNKTKLLHIQ